MPRFISFCDDRTVSLLWTLQSSLQSSADRSMNVFSVLLSLQAEGQKPYVLLSRLHDKIVVVESQNRSLCT